MAVMDYRTQDGLADYGFSIEFHSDVGWRVYIIFEPFHQGHGDSLELPFQSVDGDGRRYVDWSQKIDNLGDAKTVAGLWAEVAQRHHRRLSREQRSATLAGTDHLGDGTFVQQIRFGKRDLAVLDVSPEVSTVNWTAAVSPGRFVSEIDRIGNLAETDHVFLQMSPESRAYEITVSPLRRLARDEAFNMACEFVRIDLSPTRSVAWQTLPGEGDSLMVAGMGEKAGKVAVGDSRKFLKELLDATATSKVNSQKVISSLALLVESYDSEPTLTQAPRRRSRGASA